jgi:hypothetical protein
MTQSCEGRKIKNFKSSIGSKSVKTNLGLSLMANFYHNENCKLLLSQLLRNLSATCMNLIPVPTQLQGFCSLDKKDLFD